MGHTTVQRRLAGGRFGLVTRRELLERGYNADAINHRIEKKWLHPIFRGVYAIGRREVGQAGMWMAAVLASGTGAALAGDPAAVHWAIWDYATEPVVAVPSTRYPRNPGIRVVRRRHIDATTLHDIPILSLTTTLIDFAANHPRAELDSALNEALIKKLIRLKTLRDRLERAPRQPGVGKLKKAIDTRTFRFTRSELERALLPLARAAGLHDVQTAVHVGGREFDFYCPEHNLLIETDGGTFHRTPFRQADDAKRNNLATLHGLRLLRFTHGQIKYERAYVLETLRDAAERPYGV